MSFQTQPRAHRVPDVCVRLGLGKTKIYELIGSGRLRAVRIDGATRVLDSDLAAFEAGLPAVVPTQTAA